jgi:hypothetical protein
MVMTHKERYTCNIYIISMHMGATVASSCIRTVFIFNVLGEVNQKVFNKCQMIALLNSNSPNLLNTIVKFMNKCMSKRNSS